VTGPEVHVESVKPAHIPALVHLDRLSYPAQLATRLDNGVRVDFLTDAFHH
jgi:hypothetical protein